MVKVSKYIYVHFLTAALFCAAYVTRTLETLAAVYAVMLIHELAHALAAARLGLGISRIELYPFGVTLKVKSRVLCSVCDEVILYLSGPLVNAAAAVICALCGRRGVFYYNNILLFVLNLLPVLPLDGGQLFYGILWNYLGEKRAFLLSKLTSAVFAALLCAGVVLAGGLSVNSALFCVFVAAGVFTQKAKYSRDFVRTLAVRKRSKDISRLRVISALEGAKKTDIVKSFVPAADTVVFFRADDGRITGIKSDDEIIKNLIS